MDEPVGFLFRGFSEWQRPFWREETQLGYAGGAPSSGAAFEIHRGMRRYLKTFFSAT